MKGPTEVKSTSEEISRENEQASGSKIEDGKPSENPYEDLCRSLELHSDNRHIIANELYQDVLKRIDEFKENPPRDIDDENDSDIIANADDKSGGHDTDNGKKRQLFKKGKSASKSIRRKKEQEKKETDIKKQLFEKAQCLLVEKADEFKDLVRYAELFLDVAENMSENIEWILSHTVFGISTYYRHESDNSLSIKLEGEMKGVPIFEQLCVMKETDLYHHWAPFCSESKLLAKLSKVEVVSYMDVNLPFAKRDAVYRSAGCNCMKEKGTLLIAAKSIDETHQSDSLLSQMPEGYEIPPPPKRFGSARVDIRYFQGSIQALSATSAKTLLVLNLDPKVGRLIPKWAIEFIMKKMYGVILSTIQRVARRVVMNPVKSPHAQRIREDKEFYSDYLLPKMIQYCEELNWELPKVSALEVDEDVLMRAGELEAPTSPVNNDASSEVENGDTVQTKKSMFRGLRSPSSSNNDNHTVAHTVYTMSGLSRVFGEDPPSVSRWLKEKEEKKAEEKKRHAAALRQKAKKILRKRPKTPQELGRLKQLQTLMEEAGSDEDVTISGTRSLFSSAQSVTTHNSSMTISKRVLRCFNLSVLHPIFLYVSLLFLLFGLPSLSRWADSSLRVLSLLIGYGIVAGLTLWSSLVVSFDSAELSASSTHSLKKAKKLFVVYSGILIVTLIGAIIGFSLLRGAIIILGHLYLTDELKTSSSSSTMVGDVKEMAEQILSSIQQQQENITLANYIPENTDFIRKDATEMFNEYCSWNSILALKDYVTDKLTQTSNFLQNTSLLDFFLLLYSMIKTFIGSYVLMPIQHITITAFSNILLMSKTARSWVVQVSYDSSYFFLRHAYRFALSPEERDWKIVCIQTCSNLLTYVTTPMVFVSVSLWYVFSFSTGKKKTRIAPVTSSRISTKVKKEERDEDISDSISVLTGPTADYGSTPSKDSAQNVTFDTSEEKETALNGFSSPIRRKLSLIPEEKDEEPANVVSNNDTLSEQGNSQGESKTNGFLGSSTTQQKEVIPSPTKTLTLASGFVDLDDQLSFNQQQTHEESSSKNQESQVSNLSSTIAHNHLKVTTGLEQNNNGNNINMNPHEEDNKKRDNNLSPSSRGSKMWKKAITPVKSRMKKTKKGTKTKKSSQHNEEDSQCESMNITSIYIPDLSDTRNNNEEKEQELVTENGGAK